MKWPMLSSNFLMGTNILVLGLFLLFWLNSELKNEKVELEKDAGLQVAERLIMIGGMDLDSILWDIKSSISDSTNVEWRHKKLIQKKPFPDSVHSMHIDRDSISTSYSIVISDDQGMTFGDSINITAQLQADYMENTENLFWKALKNILPQIIFALLLFGLSIAALYLLRKNYLERQRALQAQNNMVSNITHELKTPVSTIGVALEAIQDFNYQSNPEKSQAYIKTSRNELARLSGLIDQILQFGKIDQGKAHFDFKAESINQILEDAVSTMQIQLDKKEASIEIDYSDSDLIVQADQLHLKNVFVNLLDNSLKYGPQGVQIKLSTSKQNGHVICQFADNGPGIPKEYQTKVFDRFFRISEGDTHNVKGSGLGLSYVSEIIQAHKGKIDLQSKGGNGTTILIKLPYSND